MTKPLGGNPLRLLLHEINMTSHAGTVIVGDEEFEV